MTDAKITRRLLIHATIAAGLGLCGVPFARAVGQRPNTLALYLRDHLEGATSRLHVMLRGGATRFKIGPLTPLGNGWFDTGLAIDSIDDVVRVRLETERE